MESISQTLSQSITEAKQLISDSKNIYLIPSQKPEALGRSTSEAITSTLALFYTLKQQGKNVNLILDQQDGGLPENLKFLSPSLDFIFFPKNFVISVPNSVAQISQIYYEKNDDGLKIHLTLENGNIKKDNIAFYFSETKPDLIITLGVKNYQEELSKKLNPFGFLLDSPILNIDTLTDSVQENKNFGKINLVGKVSLSEIVFSLSNVLSKELATCLLTGLVFYTNNFKKNVTANIFEIASILMKNGADLENILSNIKLT